MSATFMIISVERKKLLPDILVKVQSVAVTTSLYPIPLDH
jgi:hypothetical protein